MKKYFFIFSLLLTGFLGIQAQPTGLHPCGTENHPPKMLDWLRNNRQNPTHYRDQMTDPVYIPVKFHLVGTTQGTGYYQAVDVFRLVCDLNEQYTGVGMQFYIYGDFHYINNSNYYIHNFSAGNNMMNNNNVDDVVNVYIVEDPAGNCGYFSWNGNAVAIAKSCAGPDETTLAHELGHFFFLPHTFSGWEGSWEDGVLVDPIPNSERERVNGSNCSTTADYFCDTPADYLSYRWQCPFTSTLLDPNGVPISPDQTLFMSYAYDACTKRFSNEQIEAMIAGLNEVRDYLLDHPQPQIAEIGTSHIFYPGNGSQNINPEHVLLQWSAAPGATNYYIEVSQFTDLINGTNFSGFVTETELMLELDPGVNYFWTVQPLNPGNTCGGRATGTFLTSASPTSIYLEELSLAMPSCFDSFSGTVTLQANGGTAPYNYQWSNDLSGETQVNLPGGLYPVTVTDATGNSNVLYVNVPQPNSISANVIQTDNLSASITVSGGTIPYNIVWSSGETGPNAYGLNVGENTVTITDGNGCTLTKTINSIVIEATVNNISCFGQIDGNIDLQLIGGTPPYTYSWSNGGNASVLNSLPKGDYGVTITDATGVVLHLNYYIHEPNLLQTASSVNGTSVTVFASGGVPPYTYIFPSGAFDVPTADVTGFPAGNYEVWVYDSSGCLSISNFTLLSVGINQVSPISEIAVYPSLVHKGQTLNIELKGNASSDFNTNGRIINAEGKVYDQFVVNKNESSLIQIDTRDFSEGMYFIQLQNNEQIAIAKFLVISGK